MLVNDRVLTILIKPWKLNYAQSRASIDILCLVAWSVSTWSMGWKRLRYTTSNLAQICNINLDIVMLVSANVY